MVIGASTKEEETSSVSRTDLGLRSAVAPRRTPSSGKPDAFHRRGSLVRRRDFSLRIRGRPPAHAAHTFSPVWGKVLFRALQARRSDFTRATHSRVQKALFARWLLRVSRLGLTTQARQHGSVGGSVAGSV
jgi:hypothetical protein